MTGIDDVKGNYETTASLTLIFHSNMKSPLYLMNIINTLYNNVKILLNYPPFPINQGWTLYFKRFYNAPEVDRKTVKTIIEWEMKCLYDVFTELTNRYGNNFHSDPCIIFDKKKEIQNR